MQATMLRIADFGPYTQQGQAPGDPSGTTPPPLQQMKQQIDFIASNNVANTIRLYTLDDQQGALIDYAIQQHGLNVIPSVYLPNPNSSPSNTAPATWATISSNPAVMSELNNLVSTLKALPASDFARIPFISIGNEEISQVGGWSDTDIEMAIQYVKSQLQQVLPSSSFSQLKFTTAETYDGQYMYLLNNGNGNNTVDFSYNPANAKHYIATNMGLNPNIDVIFVNVNAYWDGISVSNAAAYVDQIYQTLQALYPDKRIVISETGWPSNGVSQFSGVFTNPQQSSVPSLANEQTYWQSFLQIANQQNISFGAFEAFNEPNKVANAPNNVENNWGLIATNNGPTYTSSTFKTTVTSLLVPGFAGGNTNVPGTNTILWQNDNGAASLWLMNGTSVSGGGTLGDPGAGWRVATTGDFNGDGASDVVWQNTDGTASLWLLNGNVAVGGGSLGNPGPSWHVMTTGDFNGDGKSDIVWQNDNGAVSVWEMNGTAVIGGGAVGNPGASWHVVGTGDFYGTGTSDLLWQNNDGSVSIWQMNGSAAVGGGSLGNPGASWHVVGTGDFNGDGKSDILWQNDSGAVSIWEMNGTSVVGGGTVANPGASWHVAGTGDFNGDGRSDILWQSDDGTVSIWEMNGTASVGGGTVTNAGTSWHVIGNDSMRFIDGTSGNATLAATPQADLFLFNSFTAGSHAITGFDVAQDVVQFSAAQFANFAAVQADTTASGGGSLIALGGSSSLFLQGVAPASLAASDFRFV